MFRKVVFSLDHTLGYYGSSSSEATRQKRTAGYGCIATLRNPIEMEPLRRNSAGSSQELRLKEGLGKNWTTVQESLVPSVYNAARTPGSPGSTSSGGAIPKERWAYRQTGAAKEANG